MNDDEENELMENLLFSLILGLPLAIVTSVVLMHLSDVAPNNTDTPNNQTEDVVNE